MRLIETGHLKTWANSKMPETRLPYWIKSLIIATVEPRRLRMPSGDAVWVGGFDGIVSSDATDNRFVPTALSVWEMGKDEDIHGKAKEDYEKRSSDIDPKTGKARPPLPINRKD